MKNGFKAQDKRAPYSLAALLCHSRTRPPLGHYKACGTKNFLTKQSQAVGRFKGTIPYQRRRLSWNYSLEKSVPLRRWVIAVNHYPLSIVRLRQFNPNQSISSCRLVNTLFSKNSRFLLPSELALHMQYLYDT